MPVPSRKLLPCAQTRSRTLLLYHVLKLDHSGLKSMGTVVIALANMTTFYR